MILTRVGNKKSIAGRINEFIPYHKTYIEPFFGAGGMFFKKKKANINILNDIDEDVYNLYCVIRDRSEEFYRAFYFTPIHEKIFNNWVRGQESEPIYRAVRFVVLSNFSYLGKCDTLKPGGRATKHQVIDNIESTRKALADCSFTCRTYLEVFKAIDNETKNSPETFCYCDPPYLGTTDTYSHSFKEEDSFNLFEILCSHKFKWAMSEFDHPFILNQAAERGLKVHILGERQNIKNRKTEILITNYNANTLF